jgi:hypothetical protein
MKSVFNSVLLTAALGVLPAAAITYNGHEYFLTAIPYANVAEAEAEAILKGGHLVTINDQTEQDFLTLSFTEQYLWIGLLEVLPATDSQRQWEWVSGESSAYRNWLAGERNNWAGLEHAVVMNWDSANPGLWNDVKADNTGDWLTAYGIIERPVPDAGLTLAMLGMALTGLAWLRYKSPK